jgi:hypothetical protein
MTGDLDDFVLSMLGTVHCRKCVGTSARGRVLPRRSPPPLYCPVDEGSRDPAPGSDFGRGFSFGRGTFCGSKVANRADGKMASVRT